MTIEHTTGTELETGYGTTTPPGDNAVLDTVRAMAAGYAALARSQGHAALTRPDLGLSMTDAASPSPFGNLCHLMTPWRSASDGDRLAAVRAFYAGRSGGPYLIFSPWPTGDLREHGLVPVGHPPLMLAGRMAPPLAGSDLVVETVRTRDELREFERTLVEAFPVGELLPYHPHRFLAPGALGSGWRFVIGSLGADVVAVAASYPCGGLRLVEMVATRPEVRGRGYGSAVTAAAARDADRDGVLVSSDLGRGVYTRLGFRSVTRFTLWLGPR